MNDDLLTVTASRGVTGDLLQLLNNASLDFVLPPELEAAQPPEARGLARDEVRLMVSHIGTNEVTHTQFHRLTDFLQAGDVLVINTSGTMNAAIKATRADGTTLELHLSTRLPAQLWVVEARLLTEKGTKPFFNVRAGEVLTLPGGASATLLTPYAAQFRKSSAESRLWVAALTLPEVMPDLQVYLNTYGFPIRYSYVRDQWPISYYQTVYATETGSAEMPSAGRAFTPELITRLVANGIQIAPLILHTGVASLESHEPPYEEYYRVPVETARIVNEARAQHRRVIAVGTTVIRALETVAATDGTVHGGEGWTEVVITPERGIHAVDGLITGLHEPRATHLAMLAALAGKPHLEVTYRQALEKRYLWHEFGDLHLILP
jgi:S-adenosylmethionine:tRNA ribosyltransferase-isomerase